MAPRASRHLDDDVGLRLPRVHVKPWAPRPEHHAAVAAQDRLLAVPAQEPRMGIRGVYNEIGPSDRISLSKLAGSCLELKKRPYRIAVDFAIWHFQAQAARGGHNPTVRLLFYRLVRLLGAPITPIFVFDGPHKPAFKRGHRTGRGDQCAVGMAKRLIRLFDFAVHDAPGEAEAECALLQQHGIVDAVLSEDVDTIMFGCTKTLREWSAEGKATGSPTHVSLYDVHAMNLEALGLDREGMVLVALMSGGDYLPEGVPGCGIKVALEAAKAGFGKSLCRLRASDDAGIQAWRSNLVHELQTNESKFFRTKHMAMTIPQDFPNLEVLGYYTHPVVSPESSLPGIKHKLDRKRDLQLQALREFTREIFGWDYRTGATKFVRSLSRSLLVQKMTEEADADATARHVKSVLGQRTHFTADGAPELRVSYIPQEVVPIDMAKEVDEIIPYSRRGLALNSVDELETAETGTGTGAVEESSKGSDITKVDSAWILEGLVKASAPGAVQQWQADQRAKAEKAIAKASKAKTKTKTKAKTTAAKSNSTKSSSDMPRGALDPFLKTTKASSTRQQQSVLSKLPPEPSSSHPLLSTAPRRPASPSKQPSLQTSKKSVKKASSALKVPDSSQSLAPRSIGVRPEPEVIVISSSPPAAPATPPPPSTSPRRPRSLAAPLSSQPDEVSGTVRSRSQSSRSHGLGQGKASPNKARREKHGLVGGPEPGSPALKQSSMHAFLTKSSKSSISTSTCHASGPARPVPEQFILSDTDGEEEVEGGKDSNLGPLSIPTRPPSSSVTKVCPPELITRSATRDETEKPDQTPSSPKKKLLRPHLTRPGFYEEVELDSEERDAELAAAEAGAGAGATGGRCGRRSKAKALRWSDVTVVDLT
ncbi:hypothetical protein E4U19_001107 [Claviceps sp. Clav32 group G5]|nr:hypothetical protein E4U19_001107 [Claviceps sp. Clav32 group G5]